MKSLTGATRDVVMELVGSRPGSEAAESAGIQPIKEPAAAILEGKQSRPVKRSRKGA